MAGPGKIMPKRRMVGLTQTKANQKRARSSTVAVSEKIKKEPMPEGPSGFEATKRIPNVFFGSSGYMYNHWKGGVYYPKGANQFRFYSAEFDSVELNSPFYRMPVAKTWLKWRNDIPYPYNFTYVIKANQYFTHWRRLAVDNDAIEKWHQFYDEGCQLLGVNLGAVLFQLPPKFRCDPSRLAAFVDILPQDGRFVFEFRDPSWFCEEIYHILRSRNICLACVNVCNNTQWAGTLREGWNPDLDKYMSLNGSCCNWGYYLRLHGSSGQYVGCYSEEFLTTLAKGIRRCSDVGRQVYVMFNNTDDGRPPSAIADLRRLKTYTETIKTSSPTANIV